MPTIVFVAVERSPAVITLFPPVDIAVLTLSPAVIDPDASNSKTPFSHAPTLVDPSVPLLSADAIPANKSAVPAEAEAVLGEVRGN